MTPADRMILIETRAMIDRFMALTDVVEMFAFISDMRSDYGVGTNDLVGLTGIDASHFHNVSRAAGEVLRLRNWEKASDAFKALVARQPPSEAELAGREQATKLIAIYDGKPLNRDDHGLDGWEPWTDDWWLKECPPKWSDHVLREAVNRAAQVPWIAALYLEYDQRLPDQAGFEYWTGLVDNGMAEDEATGWIVAGFAK